MADYAVCIPRPLAGDKLIAAADMAAKINPVNHAPLYRLAAIVPGLKVTRERIAVMTTKYWHTNGVKLTVGFLDNPPADLRAKILSHMNAWSSRLNVNFTETNTDPQVRITRTPGRTSHRFGSLYFNHRALAPDDEFGQLYHGHARLRVLPRGQARNRPYAGCPH